ncbi:MAG: DUF4126 domain-containing protein [Longimicrobiales bacterium]
MNLILAGQLAGLAFACGLNLYLTVATLGILSRFGLMPGLPPGLHGLQGWIVIASAVGLYLVETVIDKVHHADSLWDTVHTFIRPPAAALLAAAALWGQPTLTLLAGATLALGVAFAAHGTKAGLRMSLNATMHTRWQRWISALEDGIAAVFAVVALRFPVPTLAAVGVVLLATAPLAPRLWRAFRMGNRSITAWLRSIFRPARWREFDELPAYVRSLLDDTPLGAAPPRGARATLHGLEGAGAFRNGWLILTAHGPAFVYRSLLGTRRIDLPAPRQIRPEPAVWATILRVDGQNDVRYTLFLLKDGPATDLAIQHLSPASP